MVCEQLARGTSDPAVSVPPWTSRRSPSPEEREIAVLERRLAQRKGASGKVMSETLEGARGAQV